MNKDIENIYVDLKVRTSKVENKIVTDDCWAREVGKLNRCRYKDAFSLEKMRMAFESFYS